MSEPSPERVKELFHEAVGLPPKERAEFLDLTCGADRSLRRRVERLLHSHDEPGPFLESPTLQSAEIPTKASPGAPAAAAGARLRPGSMLGERYRIVELAGIGGMGEVYRAEDLKLGQTVALKLLPEPVAQDETQLTRLIEEVRLARQVSHPNVCRVYDIGEADSRHFLSMEWIEGNDLGSMLRERGRLSEDRALFVARQICAGLAAAHDRQIVHRDLKPSNVMIDGRGVARITDFGLAALSSVVRGKKAREGTPHYMSPEQLAGSEVGFASDIYSLGLVLYELLTGRPGFTGESLEELIRRRRESPLAPSAIAPEIDPAVEKLILRCLATDPKRRPASARTVLYALPGGAASREAVTAAQRRADHIAAFRAESAELRRAGMLHVSAEDQRTVERHHDRVLRDLVQLFDIDVSERGKRLSLGLRAVSLIGASALAASVFYFFYRIWGVVPTALRVGVLAAAPIASLFLTAAVARRDRSSYFTLMSSLVAFTCLVSNTSLLESTFNLTPSPLPILAWGIFALMLAYAYRLRLLLGVGLVLLAGYSAASLLHWSGGYWPYYLLRPEGFLPAGLLLFGLAIGSQRRQPPGFAPIYCVLGIVFLVAPTLFLGMLGSLSYLTIDESSIELTFQALGFAMSAGAIWFGVSRRWNEAVYSGTFFFVALLLLEFVNWWWDWMPRYLFFLIIALTSVAVAIGLKRLRATLMADPLEAG